MRLAFIEVQPGTKQEQVLRFEVNHITSSSDEEQIVGDLIIQLRARLDHLAALRREHDRLRSETRRLYADLGYPAFEVPEIGLSTDSYNSTLFEYASLDTLAAVSVVLKAMQDAREQEAEEPATALNEMDLAEGLRPIG